MAGADPVPHRGSGASYDGRVEHRFSVEIQATQARVFDIVADLETYDDWLDIVHRVEADGAPDDGAWFVTLRAKLGPLARSKRLRMIRTVHEAPHCVRFERQEHDDRDHSSWVLYSELEQASADTTKLTMTLTYGGRLWTSALNPILDAQVAGATSKLEALSRQAP